MFELDPAHEAFDLFASEMTQDVWKNKYRWQSEQKPRESFWRVVQAVYVNDTSTEASTLALAAMYKGLWLPGGRITAGAGTSKAVTLMNCYVNGTLDDSMEGIMQGNTNVALTLQQSGGIGTDFSTLRPAGAILRRTQSEASGPLPFMHMFNSTSATVRSAGDRRGAMMGTMCDTHPDLPKFIDAKHTKDALTQFNMSILVSDAFMEAVKDDAEWLLYFPIPPLRRTPELEALDFVDDETETTQYVYATCPARELWEKITRSTYEYSEPGVIFIDRINDLNNLHYCEQIRCTNPCGEQPLPPHGTCNLGHVNLARMVRNPFTPQAEFNYELLDVSVRSGTRFLDNVIDITKYPLHEQEEEELNKRRLGLGFTGLADAFHQLGIRYGTHDSAHLTEHITKQICYTAYATSIELSKERGPFPAFNADKYLESNTFASHQLPSALKKEIYAHGIRNSLLLTIAPVGTGSILLGNASSGCEPTFLHKADRKILHGFDDWRSFTDWSYSARLYHQLHNAPLGSLEIPSHMVTTEDLSIEDHIVIQAAAQRWIDASVSKTVNIPKDTPYEQFVKVYDLAYNLGCKGCTTYRPSDLRGSILSAPDATKPPIVGMPKQRPDQLHGTTIKVKWPSLQNAIYITINRDDEGRPFEIFLNSKDARYHDWMTALTLMITSIFRLGGNDISFVARELQQVQSLNDTALIGKKFHPSLVAYIGHLLEESIQTVSSNNIEGNYVDTSHNASVKEVETGAKCPVCHQFSLSHQEGCTKCACCGYSTCG